MNKVLIFLLYFVSLLFALSMMSMEDEEYIRFKAYEEGYKEGYKEGYDYGYDKAWEAAEEEFYPMLEEERRTSANYEEQLIDIVNLYSEYAVFVSGEEIVHSYSVYNNDTKTFDKHKETSPINTYHSLDYIYYYNVDIDYTVYTPKEAEAKGYSPCSKCFYKIEPITKED